MKKFMFILTVLMAVIVFAACGSSDDSTTPEDVPTVEVNNQAQAEPARTEATPPVQSLALTPAQIFEKNKYAVIQIIAFDADDTAWFGSGFIVDSTGTAVTNHHVMVGAVEAYAFLYDGRHFYITGYYSYDIGNDLAVIQIGNGDEVFQYVTLGDAYASRVGDPVFAVGGPEGDPITFTAGMISRFANEPVSFGIYTIAGMLQSTAAIYGGNSGGPLINEYGHVIGINSAGRPDRASVQWAVPVNRVVLPSGGVLNSLPIADEVPTRADGQITYVANFPFIPDFAAISNNAFFEMSGTPTDLGETSGLFYDLFDYLMVYYLPEEHWASDTDMLDEILIQHGFVFQNVVHFHEETWVYLFHPNYNISLSYVFILDYDTLLIGIGSGNVYYEFYHASWDQIPDQLGLDPTLIGIWEFWDTTNATYISLIEDGQYVLYVFEADGTGQFGSIDQTGNIVHEYNFYWGTYGAEVFIEYVEIALLLVYSFEYNTQYGALLFEGGDNDQHLLVPFE